MTPNRRRREGRDRAAWEVMGVALLTKPDRARRIDRVIDYFGGAERETAPITPFDRPRTSVRERAETWSAAARAVERAASPRLRTLLERFTAPPGPPTLRAMRRPRVRLACRSRVGPFDYRLGGPREAGHGVPADWASLGGSSPREPVTITTPASARARL